MLSKRSDEGATLVISMLVMLVLSTLSLALLTRTLALLQSTRMSQDYQAALAEADAGVADALFQLDQFGPVSPAPPAPSGERSTDTGRYRYNTERIDDATYVVRSRGSVGRATHAVSARVTRSVKFPFALFSRQTLTIDGGVKWPASGGPLPIGSNATTSCHGNVAVGSLVARATNNKDCPGFVPLAAPVIVLPLVAPSSALPCPASGLFQGSTSGTYVCRQDVSFRGVVDPTTALVIYILPSADGAQHTLDLGGAHVNVAGPASDVQVYKDGAAAITFDSGNTSDELTFRGVIYAPDSTFDVGGGREVADGIVHVQRGQAQWRSELHDRLRQRTDDDPRERLEDEHVRRDPVVGPQASGAMSTIDAVKCATCSGIQEVDATATGYRCTSCGSEWRWAVCVGCARLERALDGQESWKCTRCGRYTRSWWRSTTATEEALRIARARLELRTDRMRAREVVPKRRRRRVASVAAGVAALVGLTAAVVASAGGASASDHDRAACVAFADARSTIANGGMQGDDITGALAAVRAEAAQGSPAIALAVEHLVDAGRPGTAAYLVAQTRVVQACG